MSGQLINRISFVSSAVIPAASASEGSDILPNTPSFPSTQESVGTIRTVPVEATTVPSHAASPIIHIRLRSAATRSASVKPPNPATPARRDAPSFDIAGEELLLRDIVDKALAQDVLITRGDRLRGQELVEACPSNRLAITTVLSRKECKRAAGVIKFGVAKVLANECACCPRASIRNSPVYGSPDLVRSSSSRPQRRQFQLRLAVIQDFWY